MRASGRERTWGGGSHSLDTVLVEILHDWRLRDAGRGAALKVLIRSRMGGKLRCAIRWRLISREGHLVWCLRARRGYTPRRRSRGHGDPILGARSFGGDYLVRVLETGRNISRQAIEHALLELAGVRSRRGIEEGSGRINGRRIKSTIVMAWEVRGVG